MERTKKTMVSKVHENICKDLSKKKAKLIEMLRIAENLIEEERQKIIDAMSDLDLPKKLSA